MSRIFSGWLRMSRSLFPRTSLFQASKRAPRYPCSSRPSAWIMVPMAPSRTRMRWLASWRSICSPADGWPAGLDSVGLGASDLDTSALDASPFDAADFDAADLGTMGSDTDIAQTQARSLSPLGRGLG